MGWPSACRIISVPAVARLIAAIEAIDTGRAGWIPSSRCGLETSVHAKSLRDVD